MKRLIYFTVVLLAIGSGCKKATMLMYNDTDRIQYTDSTTIDETFVYDSASVVRDTVYLAVNTIGNISALDRPVTLTQVPEYDYTLVADSVTHLLTDTVFTPVAYPAQSGIHFLPLNDPSMDSLRVVKANQVTAKIPVVLLRDTSLKANSYRLRVALNVNRSFGLGESLLREKTIVFSDHLERFFSWRVDNTTASAYNTFGKYSTGKHQFMIDVLKITIDENWYQAALAAGALQQYKNMFKQALATFNSDPANISSGKAPLRETSSITSAVVSFP